MLTCLTGYVGWQRTIKCSERCRNLQLLVSGLEYVRIRLKKLAKVYRVKTLSLHGKRKALFNQRPFFARQIAFKPNSRACKLILGCLVPRQVGYPYQVDF